MKATLPIAALALSFLPASCDTADNLTQIAFAIEYVVETTGAAATVTQVEYTDSFGVTQVEMNPTLPWTMSASRGMGDNARLVVTGSTGAGSSITASIQDDPLLVPMPTTYTSGMCDENVDPCSIDITHDF